MSVKDSQLVDNFIATDVARQGFSIKILALASLGFGLFMFWIVPSAGVSECRPEDQRWMAVAMGSFFTLMGVWMGITAFFAKIRWNEHVIEYPDFIGRKTYALWSEIDDIKQTSWYQLGYVKFNGKPDLFFESYTNNADALEDKIIASLKPTRPYRFYVLATREAVQISKVCGCMICNSIFEKALIVNWTRENSNKDGEFDIAACPNCKYDMGVVCDLDEFEITKHGLEAVFETASKQWTSSERLTRTELRAQFVGI